jgi:hypothetical protein
MHVGGLIGQNWTGYVTHCYSIGAVSGESTFGGLIGSNVDTGKSPGVVIGCFWDVEKIAGDIVYTMPPYVLEPLFTKCEDLTFEVFDNAQQARQDLDTNLPQAQTDALQA